MIMARFHGTFGNDYLSAPDGADSIFGWGGNDAIYGNGGDDRLDGGNGDDILWGGEGLNILHGRQGNDELEANGFAADSLNILKGDRGDDFLGAAASGYTRLEGGTGNDTLYIGCDRDLVNQSVEGFLGRGQNTVSFSTFDASQFSQTHIRDFDPGLDHIQLFAQEAVARAPFEQPRTIGTAELFATMDSDHNGVLDGNDPVTDPFAFAFKLGEPEHGIGMFIQGDALVIQLPPGHDALAASDFILS
jgi:Ca2+-binding RTX toxin-like protein